MPGIVGLITRKPSAQARQELLRMVEAIRHEPSYEVGTWIDESQGLYVGWAARQNSFAGGMPLRNEAGDVVLVFAGEEFPQPDIVRHLKERGHAVETDGPSYLVHLYEEDHAFPAGLNGRFQGLLADRSGGTATLFNDRYGMHRVYYHESKDGFYFGAEAKAILAVLPELRTADPRSLGEFVACGCVLENRTIFSGIHVLPPASAWVFQNGSIARQGAYFQPQEWEQQDRLEPETYYQRLRSIFAQNLPRYFAGRERIGMSLTGGLDTRMIMAWDKSPAGTLPCYSFGGMFRDCEDVMLARRVARACGQSYEVIPVGREFLSRFSHYAERTVYLTDGCAQVKSAPDLYCNELAAAIAPVRMTGNYGGEILRRLRGFKPAEPSPDLYRPELLSHVHAACKTYDGLLGGNAVSFIAFRQVPWYHHSLVALEQTQVSVRSPFLDNDLVRTAFCAPNSAVATQDIFKDNDECVRLIGDGNATLRRMRTDRGFAASGGLRSMATRSWLEFTFKAEYAYDYGMPQWVAQIDHLFSALRLERMFLGRHKFTHFRLWYREALSQYVREMLLDPKTLSRPYLNRRGLEAMVRGHLRGDRNYTTQIHQLLTLELVHRLFLDAR
jgi:asparagine synthase (glutamine-hydrolysing)